MNWLLEDPTLVLCFLAAVAVVLVVIWWRTRDRRWLYGLGGVVVIGIAILLLGMFVNTDGKQIRDSVDAMGDAVRRKDIDGLFRHIADDFRVRTLDRAAFRTLVQKAVRNGDVTDVIVWNFEPAKVNRLGKTQGTATIRFDVKLKGNVNESLFGNCEATFTLDKDGKWKLKTFEVFNPPPGPHEPMSVPGL